MAKPCANGMAAPFASPPLWSAPGSMTSASGGRIWLGWLPMTDPSRRRRLISAGTITADDCSTYGPMFDVVRRHGVSAGAEHCTGVTVGLERAPGALSSRRVGSVMQRRRSQHAGRRQVLVGASEARAWTNYRLGLPATDARSPYLDPHERRRGGCCLAASGETQPVERPTIS